MFSYARKKGWKGKNHPMLGWQHRPQGNLGYYTISQQSLGGTINDPIRRPLGGTIN
jgi:hypothetical protein